MTVEGRQPSERAEEQEPEAALGRTEDSRKNNSADD